jgi:hypothetical protein
MWGALCDGYVGSLHGLAGSAITRPAPSSQRHHTMLWAYCCARSAHSAKNPIASAIFPREAMTQLKHESAFEISKNANIVYKKTFHNFNCPPWSSWIGTPFNRLGFNSLQCHWFHFIEIMISFLGSTLGALCDVHSWTTAMVHGWTLARSMCVDHSNMFHKCPFLTMSTRGHLFPAGSMLRDVWQLHLHAIQTQFSINLCSVHIVHRGK